MWLLRVRMCLCVFFCFFLLLVVFLGIVGMKIKKKLRLNELFTAIFHKKIP